MVYDGILYLIGGAGYNRTRFEIVQRKGMAMVEYKVDELSVVTDESIEAVLNNRISEGWHFDSIQFVVRDASKRPSMAFLFFTRDTNEG